MKTKICKPVNSKTIGFKSCGKESNYRKFGICPSCLFDWMQNDERGKIYYQTQFKPKVKKKVKIDKDKAFRIKKREFNEGNAMSNADIYFSRYIRLKHSKDGKCTCYTCGDLKPIKEVDNGHYQKREHKGTRYDENNCRPQCKTCNGDVKHNGKQDVFRVNLVNEIGEEKVVDVEQRARNIFKVNYTYFKETSDYYRNKVNELQRELKVKFW
jgi:hypothetical protein